MGPAPDLSFLTSAPAASALLSAIVALGLYGLSHPAFVARCLFRPYWFRRRHQYATIITSGFVHADLGHLLFNGFTFWAFAFGLERTIGSERFLLLYAAGLIAAAAGTLLQHADDPRYATLGASGAILAVLFASIVYHPAARLFILPLPVPIPAPLFALGYIAYTWWASGRSGTGINHDAHLAGAIAGVLFVAATDPATLQRAGQYVMSRWL